MRLDFHFLCVSEFYVLLWFLQILYFILIISQVLVFLSTFPRIFLSLLRILFGSSLIFPRPGFFHFPSKSKILPFRYFLLLVGLQLHRVIFSFHLILKIIFHIFIPFQFSFQYFLSSRYSSTRLAV